MQYLGLLLVIKFFDMCLNRHFIKNPYTGNYLYTSCGHCPSCIYEKSVSNFIKIRSHIDGLNDGYYTSIWGGGGLSILPVWVTLNYDNNSVPYVNRQDLLYSPTIPVYRNKKVRIIYNRHTKKRKLVAKVNKYSKIDCYEKISSDFSSILTSDILNLPPVVNGFSADQIAVVYRKDIQDFLKRLRYRFSELGICCLHSYYQVEEYGPTTFRPHFHCLLFLHIYRGVDGFSAFVRIKNAIASCWPYNSLRQRLENIEIARDPSKYISEYICRPIRSLSFYTHSLFRARYSHSLHFGFNFYFSPSSFKKAVSDGCFDFARTIISPEGQPVQKHYRIPDYVIRRYVPKFKGSHKLSQLELLLFISCSTFRRSILYKLGLTIHELLAIERAFRRSRDILGFSTDIEYADFYLLAFQKMKTERVSFIESSIHTDFDYLFSLSDIDSVVKNPQLNLIASDILEENPKFYELLRDEYFFDYNLFPANFSDNYSKYKKYTQSLKKRKTYY